MAKRNTKIIACILLLSLVLVSGCAEKETDPVSPQNVFLSASPIIIKEFNEQDMSITVTNNDTQAIDSVQVSGFIPFTVTGTNSINIAGKENQAESSALSAKILAPAFDTNVSDSAVTVSYLSGTDKDGMQITSTKSIPVNVIILPDVKLQFLGFVKDMDSLRTTAAESWDAEKGENATITFSVKNQGQSTIPAGLLTVVAEVDNKLIADQVSKNITQSMAKSGTSYTLGMQIPVSEDAPNGETDVYVRLMYGDNVIDEQTLVLKVKL